jgi:hypothetical protein
MTETLSTVTYRIARELGIVAEGEVTAGSTITLIDTVNLTQPDDYWNGGVAWILEDNAGAGAAPEGEWARITDFDNATNKITMGILSAATGAGDRYAVGKKRYPLDILIQKANQALQDLGKITITDTTSVDTAANQTEITLPAAIDFDNLREVWLQTQTGDADDNRWDLLDKDKWYVQKTATGTQDLLVFRYQLPTSRDLKLVYIDKHPQLYDYNDKVDESVDIVRLIYEAAARCIMWRRQKVGSMDPTLPAQLRDLQNKAAKAEAMHPIPLPPKPPKLLIVSTGETEGDKFTYPGPA